jgi:hypothetical protein
MYSGRLPVFTAFASILLFAFTGSTSAQQPPAPTLPKNPASGANLVEYLTAKTPYEFWLTCLICLLGFSIIVALLLVFRRADHARPDEIARPVIVITVIIGTLVLVTVGYSNEQIAPAFGLFGTIVGYMLGRLSQPSNDQAGQTGQERAVVSDQTKTGI